MKQTQTHVCMVSGGRRGSIVLTVKSFVDVVEVPYFISIFTLSFLQILMSAEYKRMIVKWIILFASILWVALTVCVILATLEMGVSVAQVRLTFYWR